MLLVQTDVLVVVQTVELVSTGVQVWHGSSLLDEGPAGNWDRTLISLSPGGSDADTTREFDLLTESWVQPSCSVYT